MGKVSKIVQWLGWTNRKNATIIDMIRYKNGKAIGQKLR